MGARFYPPRTLVKYGWRRARRPPHRHRHSQRRTPGDGPAGATSAAAVGGGHPPCPRRGLPGGGDCARRAHHHPARLPDRTEAMTDRHSGYVVTLAADVRDDDAEAIIT